MADAGDKYEIKGLIGQGAFGKVFLVENGAKNKLALKVIQLVGRHPKEIMQTVQEVELLARLQHDHILQYVQADTEGGKLMILTEFCPNGDLADYIREHAGTVMDERRLVEWILVKLSTSVTLTTCRKILRNYLHGLPQKIIHRDLKLANIFMDEKWDTKLGDFGIARVLEDSTDWATTQCGTPLYMSPEVFAGIPYSDKTDIYSLSIMMYEMAHMDKENIQPQMVLFKIVHQQVCGPTFVWIAKSISRPKAALPSMPTTYSSGVTDLMASMMHKDPDKRPSAAEILENKVFKKARKPPPITDRPKTNVLDDLEEEDEMDEELWTFVDTATQLSTSGGTATSTRDAVAGSTGAPFRPQPRGGVPVLPLGTITARITKAHDDGEVGGGKSEGEDDFAGNPVMTVVHRTLLHMGKTATIKGRDKLERQVDMLKMYCIQCLDNDDGLFRRACEALNMSHDEEEIEGAGKGRGLRYVRTGGGEGKEIEVCQDRGTGKGRRLRYVKTGGREMGKIEVCQDRGTGKGRSLRYVKTGGMGEIEECQDRGSGKERSLKGTGKGEIEVCQDRGSGKGRSLRYVKTGDGEGEEIEGVGEGEEIEVCQYSGSGKGRRLRYVKTTGREGEEIEECQDRGRGRGGA
ncbi:NEK6-like protein [Mya arenaria]|uniref:non-specific serine/threonine protein kinase n=1 Tax=Mya arenaria TaxID=6604 RepID=A0ABY7FSP6_MYAAR|nr:NEK6-like protein [Mya arenaria]